MADDLDFVGVVLKTGENVAQKFVELELGKTCVELETRPESIKYNGSTPYVTYQSVQRLIRSLASLQTIVDLVRPRSHLDGPNKFGFDLCLNVQPWQDRRQVIADQMRLRSRSRIECR